MQTFSARHLFWIGIVLGPLAASPPASAIGPRITVSPYDKHHLLIVRPKELVDAKFAPAATYPEPRGTFGEVTTPIVQPLQRDLKVRHAGKYVVWVRVSQRIGKPTPVQIDFQAGGKSLLQATVNADTGAPGKGGPDGYAAYKATAKKNTPKGAVASLESQRFEVGEKSGNGPSGGKTGGVQPTKIVTDDLGDDLLEELREKPADPWAHLARLEELDDAQQGFWWKVGVADLEAGRLRMVVSPAGTLPKKLADAPRFDAVVLSTMQELEYPYSGDINETPATFIRFRIDRLPKTGLRLGTDIQTHVLQQPRLSVRFGKEVIDKDDLFTEPGYTCWYRLQDVRYMPEATSHEVGIRINVNGEKGIYDPAKDYAGVTQFASFPHPDFIAREFDWNEPLALNYTCALDVENYPHRLMSFRDHAREHYQSALNAAQRLSPLTRGELYYTTICGSMDENDRDYLLKTMRLLGFNTLSETMFDGLGPKLYGWSRTHFSATMPLGDLFDEKAARKQYDEYFAEVFSTNKKEWEDTWSYCYFDEPGELYREEMTGPYWQYVKDPEGDYWHDPVGNSALHIKRKDLPEDCVLEGVIERTSYVQFRVGLDELEEPKEYRLWMLGSSMGPAINSNLAFGKYIEGSKVPTVGYRYVTALGTNLGKLKFKIVYQQGVATLFINDRTIDQQVDLPLKPSFGISGGPKKIYALRLRPMKPGEGVKLDGNQADNDEVAQLGQAVLEELELDDLPAWARPKNLKDFVDQECLYAGGVPGVGADFRRWLQTQNLKPDFFGKQSWDDVRPLTLAELVHSEEDARLYYWSRRYSSQLTPRNFGLISESIHKYAPNPKMWSYAALSGGVIYRAKAMPLDMFQVGSLGNTATGGISDWMFYSTWRWDSHQVVAYSAELYNTGARRHGGRPVSFPMMHCVAPTSFRAFTQLGAQVKLMSLYAYGPHYLNYPDSWAQSDSCYDAIAKLTARSAPVDDILAPGLRRPSRVALLYPHSTEYWSTEDSFDDRRGVFLALSHEYYQPEVVTEQQIKDGALKYYDALYVVDRHVAGDVQKQINGWVSGGGLLWCCADALTRDEYDQPSDLLKSMTGIDRTWAKDIYVRKPYNPNPPDPLSIQVTAAGDKVAFRPHRVWSHGLPEQIKLPAGVTPLAKYADGRPAWCELPLQKGRVVYVGHRAGSTYTAKNILVSGHRALFPDTGRELLTAPLHQQKVPRELVISQPTIMASPISTEAGTAIVLYNMRAGVLQDLQLQLREPAKPFSVAHLENGQLVDLKFDYAGGVATIQLPSLNEEDILYVRRAAVAGDDRLAFMEARTKEQLQASDVESLSAGAWFAGFYPQWKLADQIVPLAGHADWRIRRAAAETLGRLKHTAGGDVLLKLVASEKDPHVIAEQLHALAQLEHPQLVAACVAHLADRRFVVRQSSLQAMADQLARNDESASTPLTDKDKDSIRQAGLAGITDADQRVRKQAMRILVLLEPLAAVQMALASYADREIVAELDRPLWAEAIAKDNGAYTALWSRQPAPELKLLIDLGLHRRDPRLAAALVKLANDVTKEQSFQWSQALLKQHNPEAARQLLAARATLKEPALYYLPMVLEQTFQAGLGNVLEDWEAKLAQ